MTAAVFPGIGKRNAAAAVRRIFLAALSGSAISARALGPQEIALLVNANSQASMEVANEYARLRDVPAANMIYLDLHSDTNAADGVVSTQEFMRAIWTPATNELARRKIGDHILAWVYSVDFPTAVRAGPDVSIHGMTFVRGKLPSSEAINRAGFSSPLFRGPGRPDGPEGPPVSLEQFALALTTNMPLPAMTLGQLGPLGQTADEIIAGLRMSAMADGSDPTGVVNFVESADVRSTCRAWEVPGSVAELARLHVKAVVTTNQPDRADELIGLQAGTPDIAGLMGVKLLPGSMAEHLTSYAAVFSPGQSKLTQWLRAGAAGSAGTVSEPYSLWPKFPHARFFVFYASGCTMLESFYEAVASPLQTLFVGDPLARPFGRPPQISLLCMADDDADVTGIAEFVVTSEAGGPAPSGARIFLLDGEALNAAGTASGIKLDTRKIEDGFHELRVIAYSPGDVHLQSMATTRFSVRNHGHAVSIVIPAAGTTLGISPLLTVTLKAEGYPQRYEIFSQGRLLAESTNEVLAADLRKTGAGPVWLQAAARYNEGDDVRSRPVLVSVTRGATGQ